MVVHCIYIHAGGCGRRRGRRKVEVACEKYISTGKRVSSNDFRGRQPEIDFYAAREPLITTLLVPRSVDIYIYMMGLEIFLTACFDSVILDPLQFFFCPGDSCREEFCCPPLIIGPDVPGNSKDMGVEEISSRSGRPITFLDSDYRKFAGAPAEGYCIPRV